MVCARCSRVLLLLALFDIALTDILNVTSETKNSLNVEAINKKLDNVSESKVPKLETKWNTRRKKKHRRSTSSSSGEKSSSSGSSSDESLKISTSSESTDKSKSYRPKSSVERHGWRKWHRKCQGCPEEMSKKWKDQSIKWICGGYQRARRSFKSLCMMHYRNCQDGTMFVKIRDYRCDNDTKETDVQHGEHFFYDYKARLSDDSSSSSSDITGSSSSSLEESTDY